MGFILEEGQHRFTNILVCDEPGAGGAYHHYEIIPAGDTERTAPYAVFPFQNGPVAEAGKNGIFIEDLLQICEHRLKCFQAGAFACKENEQALEKIQEALHWLNSRTSRRQRCGIEGTYKPD